FLLGIVGEALDLGLLAVDVLCELRARRVAEHAAARVELLLRRLQRRVLRVQLGDLLIVERLHAGTEQLALRGLGRDALDVDERVLRAGRKRRFSSGRSLCGRRRRRSGRRGLSEGGGGSQHHTEGRGNDKSSHYSQSFPVVRKLKIVTGPPSSDR